MSSTPSHDGVVAAGHIATAEAAADMLRQGGNAVDAVIAGVFASMIAETVLTGLFGGGILTVQLPDGRGHVLDGFACMPGLGGPPPGPDLEFFDVCIDFGPVTQEFHVGRGAAAVPGNHRALFEAHRRWGSLPMATLVEPACQLAVAGVPLPPQMAFIFSLLEPILLHTPEARALYAPHGRLLKAGERHRNPDLGELLARLAAEGLEGPTGRALEAAVVESFGAGFGLLTEQDLLQSRPVLREPLVVSYRDAEVELPPAPTMGGPLVALGLRMLERAQPRPNDPGDELAWMAEIQRCMTEARSEDPAAFLAADAVDALYGAVSAAALGATPRGSTTHISVVDKNGMAAGMTHSNGEGCGHVIPGTGVMMNNFLGEEDINPTGFHKLPAGARMPTMMCPTVMRRGATRWVFGSGGSNRIRTAILQVIHYLIDRNLSPRSAVDAPRMHVEGEILNIETGGRPDAELAGAMELATEIARFEAPNMFFGGVHLVEARPDRATGAGDTRRGGTLVVV